MVATSRVVFAWLVVGSVLAGGGAAQASAATTATATFSLAGEYSFTVPAGVSSVSVTAVGAAGGAELYGSCDAVGGDGASVSATLPVSSGEQLISPRTVGWHLSNVYAKLGVNSRGELAAATNRHHNS